MSDVMPSSQIRAGTGTGRTYTLLYEATDALGNTATATVIVTVPHDAP